MNFGIALVIGAMLAAVVGLSIWERRSRRRLLAHRVSLTPEEIYKNYYGGSGIDEEALFRAWHEVASYLGVDQGRLRPEDTFSHLNTSVLSPSDIDDLEVAIQSAMKSGYHKKIEDIETVDELVRLLALGKA